MNKKKTQKKETGETDSLTDYDVSVNESKSLGSCFWTIFSRVMIVVVSPRVCFDLHVGGAPPFKILVVLGSLFLSVSGVNEPRHHSTNLSGRGALEETHQKGEK
jgi:hypothetical protein